MFRLIGFSASALALAVGSATAADIGRKPTFDIPPPPKAQEPYNPPISEPTRSVSWGGVYLGAFGSWTNGEGRGEISSVTYQFPQTGFVNGSGTPPGILSRTDALDIAQSREKITRGGGLMLGANVQSGSFVAGLETDLNIPNGEDRYGVTRTNNPFVEYNDGGDNNVTDVAVSRMTATTSHRRMWDGSLRARVGLLLAPEVLLYGTAGVAAARFHHRAAAPDSISFQFGNWGATHATHDFNLMQDQRETRLGWTLGGGVEMKLNDKISLRTEYRFADFGTDTYTKRTTATCTADPSHSTACSSLPAGQATMRTEFHNAFHTVRFGLAYQFSTSEPKPVAARY